MKRIVILALCSLALASASVVMGASGVQGLDRWDLTQEIIDARAANQQALKAYSWTQRTEVVIKGEVRVLRTELLRYASDGQLQRSPMGEQPQQQGGRGIRGRKKASKQQEMRDWAGELAVVIAAYGLGTPGELLDFITNAALTEQGASLQAEATAVLVPNDHVSIWYDRQTMLVTRMQVQTTHDGDAVELDWGYRVLDSGPSYIERLGIRVPAQSIEMTIENFNYMRQ